MNIRNATMNDIEEITRVEAECFPVAEASTKEEFAERIKYYGNHFWLMFDEDKLIAFVDGFVTNEKDLTDKMYEQADMHDENGEWQMIFGVNTAKKQKRKGVVLTCKQKLVGYYSKFGFIDEGISDKSVHGNVVWHQMRLTF